MISLRQWGGEGWGRWGRWGWGVPAPCGFVCKQKKRSILAETWLGFFSRGDQVIPTNDALREREWGRETRGVGGGVGGEYDDAGMHVGKKKTSFCETSQSSRVRYKCESTQETCVQLDIKECSRINHRQRAPERRWCLFLEVDKRFLKGIRGFLRLLCCVFRENETSSLTEH